MKPSSTALKTTAAVAAAAIVAAFAAIPTGAATPPQVSQMTLSNERTLSRWAYPTALGPIYARPSGKARRVSKLRLLTEDHLPELYMLLKQMTDSSGNTWVQIRLPKRPNGQTGWVPRGRLGDYHIVRTQLVINKRTLRATLYKSGRSIFSARVGVGRPGLETPSGRFWVREKFRVRGAPAYGPMAIGTSAYSPHLTDWPNGGVVGLHGTNEPGLIPGRPSHGCIRLRNNDIARLYRLMPRGTPVRIL